MDRFIRTAFVASLLAFGLLLLSSERGARMGEKMGAEGSDTSKSFGEPHRVADAR